MKHSKKLFGRMLAVFFLTIVQLTACVNKISDEEIQESNIPINFTAKVSKSTTTKVTDTGFEDGDRIGLFATISGTPIDGQRYINNLRLEYGTGSDLIAEREVFYPEGGAALDFIAYYPYQTGIAADESLLPVAVQTDQSSGNGSSLSDFLIATKNNVSSSNEAVALAFKHQFARLKIELIPKETTELDDMLNANPRITASGFFTTANYDLTTQTLDDLGKQADIVASGSWKKGTGKLTGKEIIVIPQQIGTGERFIIIEWNGKVYTCPVATTDLASNTQRTIQIKMEETVDQTLSGIVGSVEPWDTPTEQEDGEGVPQTGAVHVTAFSFSTSSVYRVYNSGFAVAEVCKEYLLANNVAAQAIVAYPVKNERTDLSEGVVLQLLGESGAVHGGTVSWGDDNSLTYTPGTSEPIDNFYITDAGEISLDRPENYMEVSISSYTLRDIRKGVLQTYPIVKIGTQYWMRQDLKATAYTDGLSIPLRTDQTIAEPGYFKPSAYNVYLYNGYVILTQKIAPEGWKIPRTSDWTQLQTYLQDDAALLKAGDWQPLNSNETEAKPANNLSGFGAYPVGIWNGQSHFQAYKLTAYWSVDEDGTSIPENTIFLSGSDEKFASSGTVATNQTYYKVLSIRCLMER